MTHKVTVDVLDEAVTPGAIIDAANRIIEKSIDLDLDIDDMTADQQRDTAEALKTCAGMFSAYAADFRNAATNNSY
ncbi:hypothetical protein LJR030_001517 [Rhizobium sp. LjRoot30]|uniref:hypothetical protein n=1 Tax=Rhizobium sp. LjRoot30 TaxID=3342320 RepID=UPI003ECD6637